MMVANCFLKLQNCLHPKHSAVNFLRHLSRRGCRRKSARTVVTMRPKYANHVSYFRLSAVRSKDLKQRVISTVEMLQSIRRQRGQKILAAVANKPLDVIEEPDLHSSNADASIELVHAFETSMILLRELRIGDEAVMPSTVDIEKDKSSPNHHSVSQDGASLDINSSTAAPILGGAIGGGIVSAITVGAGYTIGADSAINDAGYADAVSAGNTTPPLPLQPLPQLHPASPVIGIRRRPQVNFEELGSSIDDTVEIRDPTTAEFQQLRSALSTLVQFAESSGAFNPDPAATKAAIVAASSDPMIGVRLRTGATQSLQQLGVVVCDDLNRSVAEMQFLLEYAAGRGALDDIYLFLILFLIHANAQ